MFLWIRDRTVIEDVLGTMAEPAHSQCCAAVHAGPEQRWAHFVAVEAVEQLDHIESTSAHILLVESVFYSA